MKPVCGECLKPFSQLCGQQRHCQIHQENCFSCKECKSLPILTQICSLCDRKCEFDEIYYDIYCKQYICRRQFTNINIDNQEIEIPCGCTEMREHFINFMSCFCFNCARRLTYFEKNEINICWLCSQTHSNEINKQICPVKLSQMPQQYMLNSRQLQVREHSSNLQQLIKILNVDLQKSKQQLSVSEFTRLEIKKKLLCREREKECLICFLPYDVNMRRPMMICLQQHLICQVCFQLNTTLITCPLCREILQKDKIITCRERLRTLQLQKLMQQKFSCKLKQLEAYKSTHKGVIQFEYEVGHVQTQTDAPKEQMITLANQRPIGKRTRQNSKPRGGQKKVKLIAHNSQIFKID